MLLEKKYFGCTKGPIGQTDSFFANQKDPIKPYNLYNECKPKVRRNSDHDQKFLF